jgi:hypothetical protein
MHCESKAFYWSLSYVCISLSTNIYSTFGCMRAHWHSKSSDKLHYNITVHFYVYNIRIARVYDMCETFLSCIWKVFISFITTKHRGLVRFHFDKWNFSCRKGSEGKKIDYLVWCWDPIVLCCFDNWAAVRLWYTGRLFSSRTCILKFEFHVLTFWPFWPKITN